MKKALIIIDMQKAFFANSALEKERIVLTNECNELSRAAREHQCPVFSLRTVHSPSRDTWTLNMLDDDKGYLFENDDDAEYVEGLDIEETIEIKKTRDSGFWQTDLLMRLRRKGIDTVVLCGVSTHSCVALTATDAYNANLRVELAIDAIASHDPAYHDSCLSMLSQEYRMKQLHNNEISWND